MDGKWLDRGECPECGSSDANVTHSEGYSHCFSCNTHFKERTDQVVVPMQNIKEGFTVGEQRGIDDRKIKVETCKKYNTFVKANGNTITHHIYQYFNTKGEFTGNKVKQVEGKKYWSEGDIQSACLFGQNVFTPRGKYVTICEGELDAMSAYELLGSKWPCVSIKSGAQAALQDCKRSFEYLNSFDNVVLCFDSDAPGIEAASKVAQLFEPNKCKIIHLEYKDANEYLKMNKRQKFTEEWWNAKPFTPAGIINLDSLQESLYDESFFETCLYPWQGLNDKTYGMRTGELVTFTSGAGMGKSSVMRELMHHLLKSTKHNIGILAMEESIRNTAFNIMSVEADARLYIKEVRDQYSRKDLEKFQKNTVGTGRFFAFDHFGSISNDEILSRIRYMTKALECKWIILDHLSILVSGQEDFGDERKSIDILMTKLRSLVEETGCGLLLVSHLRRPSGDNGHENGKEITLSHLRGSASIAHLSDSVIGLERNQQAGDETEANTTVLRVLKNRYTGDTGVASYLFYDKDTGRLTQVDNPFEVVEDE
tara:strand:+ start:2138 stop:3754 length:1617 start_codon:yes stop_codon:yes gene_type:complete